MGGTPFGSFSCGERERYARSDMSPSPEIELTLTGEILQPRISRVIKRTLWKCPSIWCKLICAVEGDDDHDDVGICISTRTITSHLLWVHGSLLLAGCVHLTRSAGMEGTRSVE